MPVDWGISERKLGLGTAENCTRPLGDVPACRSIPISLVSTPNTSEVAVTLPVLFAYMSAPWAGLASVRWLDFNDQHSFLFCCVFQGMPEETVRNAVHLLSALLCPFAFTLSEMSESFDGYVGIELLSQLNDLVAYLPHSCSDIVSLFSADPLELESSLASGNGVSVLLELGSPHLKAELLCGNVLSIVGLLQYFALTDYGYGDLGAVDVDAHPVWSGGWLGHSFGEDGKEAEVPLHDDAGQFPALLEMFLNSLVGSILRNRYSNPLMVESEAEGWIASLGLPEAEETAVESDNTLVRFILYGFAMTPSVEDGFQDQLGCHTIFASEVLIVLLLELSAGSSSPSQRQQLPNHAEESLIRLLQQPLFSFGGLEKVQRQTLLHPAVPNRKIAERDLNSLLQFLPTLTDGDSLEVKC